ncbi:hypothetical protein NT6N_13310 [Oceaniferula spumae]|uniref:Peptidase A2 domain-containing protein n=1 Tax=Oceaniferula spumae TaxID=2979115 RepID=A0AAT9FJN2_9BACT
MNIRILLTLACAASPVTAIAQEPAAKQSMKMMALPIEKVDAGTHWFIKAQVDGETVDLLVDSGSSYTAIYSKALADKLGKKLESSNGVSGVAGKVKSWKTTFDKVRVGGGLNLKKTPSQVLDLSHLEGFKVNGQPRVVSGLIGAPLLSAARAVFDPENNRILVPTSETKPGEYLKLAKARKDIVVPLAKGGDSLPFIKVDIKGETLGFVFDTAAGDSTMQPELVEHFKLKTQALGGGVRGAGTGGSTELSWTMVEKPLIGKKLQVSKHAFVIVDSHAKSVVPDGMKLGGVLSVRRLKSFKGLIDFDSYSYIIPRAGVKKQ